MKFKRSDLIFEDYRWSAREEYDDPCVIGEPDSTLLDRTEGYEVLYFINAFGRRQFKEFPPVAILQRVEKAIRKCPTSIRSQKGIEDWIVSRWKEL